VLFPGHGAAKVDLIDYYDAVAPAMLPHVRDRLMTLERFPDGIDSARVFSKDIPGYFPEWIARRTVAKKGGTVTHVVCNDRATLVYLADQACVTLHVGLSRLGALDRPDHMMWDLDPPDEDARVVSWAAGVVRSLLSERGLVAFVKSTGSRGLHIVVPLDGSERFPEVRRFTRDVAGLLAARHTSRLTVEQRKGRSARGGSISTGCGTRTGRPRSRLGL
jgi:bifunctional non-homologous end joining protein LigD